MRPKNLLLALSCLAALQACAVLVREVKEGWIQASSKVSSSEIHLTIANSFLETYKDRVTIDVLFDVDQMDPSPHPALLDGDFHIAGHAAQVGLPIVAEIQNAAFEGPALDVVRAAKRGGESLRLAGAWRIWSEHPGKSTDREVQGEQRSPIEGADPAHVFEIHPVTAVKDLSLVTSLQPIRGYSPGLAEDAFKNFASLPCRLQRDATRTTLVTRKGAINDVEFLLEMGEQPQRAVADGRFVSAAALSLKGERLVSSLTAVFVKDSAPERAVKRLRPGDRLHVLGLPRVDLAAVDYRARHAIALPEVAALSLPYEIVIVAVYDAVR